MVELVQGFGDHPNQIKQRRDQRRVGAPLVFGDGPKAEPEPVIAVTTLACDDRGADPGNRFLSGARCKARPLPKAMLRSVTGRPPVVCQPAKSPASVSFSQQNRGI
ncbi:hypothetical protein ACN2XU_21135 [Primorskyibacter sp. 2E107]|uniref:hypothetical protein n=1 Tax=Primorskyibacter sp. 2E107 TaxID=3403458 RepID=UPI003AF9ED2F